MAERRLYLLRHAKSSWKEQGLADRDRPLAGRGRRATKTIRRYLKQRRIDPELVLCSTATRARQTLEGIEPALGRGSVRVEPELYGAGSAVLLARLQDVPAGVRSVMVIGHNPGLQDFALLLARPDPTSSRRNSRPLPWRRSRFAVPTGPCSIAAWRS